MAGERFLERSLRRFASVWERALESEEVARQNGLLQALDPRVKLIGLSAVIVAAVMSRRLSVILAIFVLALLLAICSRVPLRTLALRAWVGVLAFTGIIALPAVFITPGRPVFHIPLLQWTATAQGLRGAGFLIARTETTATLSLLLVLCTQWTRILRAMRALRIPVVLVVIFGMTYRYILLSLETAAAMFEARQSRVLGALPGKLRRKVAVATAGVLLDKSVQTGGDVYLAMQSRGFSGEIYVLDEDECSMKARDLVALTALLGLATAAFWLGRS
jgi:cobalt/nickel transport system permease protein